ncbi:hypothetical protein [Denitratisoma oestradiolicum]|nr:hypothetical protein [Denitratisoma oestradiolicum]
MMKISDIGLLSNGAVCASVEHDRLHMRLGRVVSMAAFKAFMFLGMHLGRVEGRFSISLPATEADAHEAEVKEVLDCCARLDR